VRAAIVVLAALVVAGLLASLGAGSTDTPRARTTAAAAVAGAGGGGCVPLAAGSHRLPSIGGRVPVVIHVGRGVRAGAPLILGLPGAGQTARDFAQYTGYSALADQEHFSVAYATATGSRPFWNVSGTQPGKPDDVAYLREVIAAAVRATCADPARVGVTGVSNGGGMSARLACDAADLLAAAAPVAGGYSTLPACHPARPVAILEVHGDADHVVPYNGKGPRGAGSVSGFLAQWRALDGCTGAGRTLRPRRDVIELRWSRCRGGAIVQHDRIRDADHGWPGEDDLQGRDRYAATVRTWAFLSSFRAPNR
jgi:polyhydroxybutyrate depolymerase